MMRMEHRMYVRALRRDGDDEVKSDKREPHSVLYDRSILQTDVPSFGGHPGFGLRLFLCRVLPGPR